MKILQQPQYNFKQLFYTLSLFCTIAGAVGYVLVYITLMNSTAGTSGCVYGRCSVAESAMLATVIYFSVVIAGTSAGDDHEALDCPLWTAPVNGSCQCGDSLRGIVSCDDRKGALLLNKCFCMTTWPGGNSPLVGTCLYSCNLIYPQVNVIGVNTTAEITSMTCGPFKRTGVMCGECLPGYGLPVYSYSLSCVECTQDYKFNLLKYVAVAYIPLTVFFFIVIILRISATSGYLLGYVTICQILMIKAFAAFLFNISQSTVHTMSMCFMTVLSFWNLDFFRALYPPFCLSPHLTTLQVLLLDYLIAV